MNTVLELLNRQNFDPRVQQSTNQLLMKMSAEERVVWALNQVEGGFALSSSFGIQSAVMLHLVSSLQPNIPVILADTGYLFPETYQYIDYLAEHLDLNLVITRSKYSPAWQLARYGKEWEQGKDALVKYNYRNKVEPLESALDEHRVNCWFSGIRRQQSKERESMDFITQIRGRIKVHPILDWTNRDIFSYLNRHKIQPHPLWEKGFTSVGDIHSTNAGEFNDPNTRFNGIKRECGIHL